MSNRLSFHIALEFINWLRFSLYPVCLLALRIIVSRIFGTMNLQHELTRFAFLLIMSVSRTGFHTLLSALNFPRDRETIKMFSFFTLLTNAFKLSLCWRKTCPCMQPVAFCTPPMHTMGKCSQPATALQNESLRFFLNKQIPFLPGFGSFLFQKCMCVEREARHHDFLVI